MHHRLCRDSYDELLNLSRSLNIAIENKTGGCVPNGRFIGCNAQSGVSTRSARSKEEYSGFRAPLVRKGSKLRIARPEKRNPRRMEFPQTEGDLLKAVMSILSWNLTARWGSALLICQNTLRTSWCPVKATLH